MASIDDDMCGWVKCLWKNLLEEIIICSFKKCDISNELDGSEDDVIYEDIDEIIREIQDENEKEELEIININEDEN
ncbi:6254_t:CDS:2 [Rhizophagus irregularis]|nr:6254_t:CDS:2 [Rhizophagus irregularis]